MIGAIWVDAYREPACHSAPEMAGVLPILFGTISSTVGCFRKVGCSWLVSVIRENLDDAVASGHHEQVVEQISPWLPKTNKSMLTIALGAETSGGREHRAEQSTEQK